MNPSALTFLILSPVFFYNRFQEHQFIQKIFSKLVVSFWFIVTRLLKIQSESVYLFVQFFVNSPTIKFGSTSFLYFPYILYFFIIISLISFCHHCQNFFETGLVWCVGASFKTMSLFFTNIAAKLKPGLCCQEESLFLQLWTKINHYLIQPRAS